MKFYELNRYPKDSESDAVTQFLQPESTNRGPGDRCPACNTPVSSRRWLPPYEVELELWGRTFGDVVLGSGDSFLVSEHFKTAWPRSGLRGLSGFDPVRLIRARRYRRSTDTPPAYFKVDVVRSETAVDQQASGVEWVYPNICPTCLQGGNIQQVQRLVIDESTWTGEDLFYPRGIVAIVVTERFKEFCTEHDFKNAVLVPGEQVKRDYRLGKSAKPKS